MNDVRGEKYLEVKIVTRNACALFAKQAVRKGGNEELGKELRLAWKELQNEIKQHDINVNNNDIGYVLSSNVNETSNQEVELWVGVEVEKGEMEKGTVTRISIPEQQYASITCRGNANQLQRTYEFLYHWLAEHQFKVTSGEGVYKLEVNRLHPVNPFELPAGEANEFDFDILFPIQHKAI